MQDRKGVDSETRRKIKGAGIESIISMSRLPFDRYECRTKPGRDYVL
jgi:hypothetical protein